MKNMLAGAFIAAALSLGVFVATLVFGPRLFFPTPQTKSLAVEVEPSTGLQRDRERDPFARDQVVQRDRGTRTRLAQANAAPQFLLSLFR